MNRIIAGLIITLLPCAALAQGASTTADRVPIEEYVPKVIIEGKWGTGPGEFGVAWTYASDVNVPQDESGTIPPLYPSSLAVNSEGQIYILDSVNNRIQKFTADGTFMKSIPVDAYVGEDQPIWYGKVKGESGSYVFDKVLDKNLEGKEIGVDKWFPFFWPLTVQGINIVIDSKDNLYYYLKRTKDGKETGEVWQFRNDKLVKKQPENPDEIAVPGKPRGVPRSKHPSINWEQAEISKDAVSGFNIAVKGEKHSLKIKLRAGETLPGRAIFDKKERRWEIVVKRSDKLWNHYYDESGKLIKISEVPELSEYVDRMGNYYYLDKTGDVFRVRKAELVRVRP